MADRLVYMPWPTAMDLADRIEANGHRQLAREVRLVVWRTAEMLWEASRG